jgi:SAM-dependent methyltransferase
VTVPTEFDASAYRAANSDLVDLAIDDLARHYREYGEDEGRRANAIASREAFAGLIPPLADSLEIGPYYSPLLNGPNTRYFDVLSREAMISRAAAEGFDGTAAPVIDYVSPTGDLGIVPGGAFDFVLSSHALEHQPDLVSHLHGVERLLRPGGRYLAIVPDKRYCYDHFNPESTIAEIVEAHAEKRRVHTLRNVLNQHVMTTHNDCVRHWDGDHGNFLEACDERIRAGMLEYTASNGEYIDVHAWYFTPASARTIFRALRDARFTSLVLERMYPTRRHALEFWMVLRLPAV